MKPSDKPIGFWLKHLHNLIEAHFEADLADYRMTRRHWQILNLLSSGQRSRTEALQSLAPFWDDATQSLDALLDGPDGMIARHWVRSDDGATGILALTD